MSSTDAPRGAASAASAEDDDPIVASYSVFIKPPLPANRNLVVLQYVNKTAQDPAQIRVPRIAELRVKPSTAMYEVDVPIDTTEAYDRSKGVAWGTALQKSMEAKKGGSLGLAGGFNIVATSTTTGRGRRGAGVSSDDELPLTWAEAARQDKVLRTQTFGGGRSAQEANTRHMIGVFQGKNLHLTPVTSVVHLRPVPHHLDAATEQERLSRSSASANAATANNNNNPSTSAAEKASAGRAIHMTIKSAMDADGGVSTETMADRLRGVQTENWQRMEWVHDEAEMAWEAYNECLLLRSSGTTNGGGDAEGGQGQGNGKGKGKEGEAGTAGGDAAAGGGSNDDSGAADLVEKVPRLRTDWGEQELLRATSGVQVGGEGDRKQEGSKEKDAVVKTEGQQRVDGPRQTARAGRSTTNAASAAAPVAGPSAPRKATRRTANRGGAMEID